MIGEWTEYRHIRELPKQTHGGTFLFACCRRLCRKSTVEDQCKNGYVLLAKGFEREQRVIDSTEADLSDYDGR